MRTEEEKLGVTIVGDAENTFLVQAIKDEGLVPVFNATMEGAPESQVQVGDLIVAVNAVFGNNDAMTKELQQKTIVLTMKRKAAEEAAAAEEETPAAPATEGAAEPAPVAEPAAEPAVATDAEVAPAEAAPAAADDEEPAAPIAAPADDQFVAVTEDPLETTPEEPKKALCC